MNVPLTVPSKMLNSASDLGRKRRRNGTPPESNAKRRVRSAIDVSSLSPAQVATLSEAASILRVELSDLPVALGNLSQSLVFRSQAPSTAMSQHQLQVSSDMDKVRYQSKTLDCVEDDHSRTRCKSCSVAQASSESASDSCSLSFYGMGLMPKQIADCFTSFTLPTEHRNERPYNPDVPYVDASMIPDIGNILPPPLLPPEFQIQTNNDVDLIDLFANDLLQNDYACNHLVSSADGWLAAMGGLPDLQYTQPVIAPSPMLYPLDPMNGQQYKISSGGEPDVVNSINHSSLLHQAISSSIIDMNSESHPDGEPSYHDLKEHSQWVGALPRRKFHSTNDRQKTAQTRKLTACVRCRMQRIRCEPDPLNPKGACLTCQRVIKPTMRNLPCMRYKLTEVRLFREGSLAVGREWSHRWSNNKMNNITAWASTEMKKIHVTQDYGPNAIVFEVREFVPMEGDMLQRQWSDNGVIKSITMPNYAIVDMAAALQAYKEFIVNEGPQFFRSTIDYNDRLLWDTYTMALRFSKNSPLVDEREVLQMVLQLWVTVRMCTRSAHITGRETLGMVPDTGDMSYPMKGKIPIPPVLGAQINLIISHKLQAPLRSRILDRLQKLILAQKPENWFCVYLCIFVLLHNCSLLTEHDIGYARKHGLKSRHARPDMVAELHFGANVLLAHFHYCCKGFRPFSLDWKPAESTSMATLDDEQLRFMRQTADYVDYNQLRFEKLLSQGAYESEFYFVAQLYEEGWKPRPTV
jgi:hypothetical protein